MQKYEIELYENENSEDSLIFECDAIDENDAARITVINYPNCILLSIMRD
jgi:hypothetical protein